MASLALEDWKMSEVVSDYDLQYHEDYNHAMNGERLKDWRIQEDGALYFHNRLVVPKVDEIKKIKVKQQKLAGELQPLPVPGLKWEHITMDFLMGLPRTEQKHNAIWVVVDMLTKSAHFVPFYATYSQKILAELYLEHIVRLHGVPLSITSDHDTRFNARNIFTLLSLPTITAIRPVSITVVRERLLTAESRQKSYADRRCRPLEFQEGHFILLKVSSRKGVAHFGVKEKLTPRYVGPFPIVQ
ncbi:uncharacterized protein LOC112091131 [Morus notabilis]|uniref:uncharacterized protein LOC112091131 n=1 Tax=Morus notabilis TaxID=981085 RepID=UPI000CED3309|nr:uncharacterized protein LOC112091131 [Morus notabilis]